MLSVSRCLDTAAFIGREREREQRRGVRNKINLHRLKMFRTRFSSSDNRSPDDITNEDNDNDIDNDKDQRCGMCVRT